MNSFAQQPTIQQVSNLVDYIGATNSSNAELPPPNDYRNDAGADPWREWKYTGYDHLGKRIDEGRFWAFRVILGNQNYTLVMLIRTDGGFGGSALCDGRADDLKAAGRMWLQNAPKNSNSGHQQIHEITKEA